MDLSLLFWIVLGVMFVGVPFAAALGINEIVGNLMTPPPKVPKAKETAEEVAERQANVRAMIRRFDAMRADNAH